MQTSIATSHLLLVLLVQLVPAQIQPTEEGHSGEMKFLDVLLKSMCRPMEQLVYVAHEFPSEVEYVFLPACVPLWRCSGCCLDENLECHPTLERNITLPMKKIAPAYTINVDLTFVEHVQCECRPHWEVPNNESRKKKSRKRRHKKKDRGCGKCQFPHTNINLH